MRVTLRRIALLAAMLTTTVWADTASLKQMLKTRVDVASSLTALYQKHDTAGLKNAVKKLKALDAKIRKEKTSTDLHDYLLFAQYCIEDIEHAMKNPVNKGNIHFMHDLQVALIDTDKYVLSQLH